ncbi:3 beta-hydroxysteroid dehydrogenase/Delta 5--_4-isomerase-like isoform X4 [Hemicordylus capensis]|uniref:3 beta-hydroxysteroid dehydrogenase/Delta 5-->4-isomerase-like isoform X4 n=1 Tax=Hemicordylus capensis TaxID=884348 RepID=UPI00230390B3|nr:3 beta-hydroxysteroid dehydrogenase/Delta 5-->4-isomerase-like isoform X4 [Hemicordylus capensis]
MGVVGGSWATLILKDLHSCKAVAAETETLSIPNTWLPPPPLSLPCCKKQGLPVQAAPEHNCTAMSLAGLKCLVTGAGGFLGRRIVCQLLEEEEGLAEVRVLDKTISSELLQNFASTQLLLETCIFYDVPHFIYTSSLEVAGPNCRGDPIYDGDEDTVYQSTTGFLYAETKRAAEKYVLDLDGLQLKNGTSLVTCALRSMYIFGEGSTFLLQHLDECILNNNVFLRNSRKEAFVNPVYVGNIAWAHIQLAKAMRDPEKVERIRGQFYYISDDTPHVSYADFNYELAKELGFGIEPKLPMPLMMFYCYALLLEIVSFLLWPFVRYIPVINRQLLTLLNTPFTFSYKKARRDFGYRPRYTWEEAKQQTSQWIAEVAPLRAAYLKNKTL